MLDRLRKALAICDVAGVPLFVGWFIWRGQFDASRAWLWAAGWLVASFLFHRDTPKTLGMRADNLWPATVQAAIVYGAFAAGLVVIGLALRRQLHSPPNYR